MVRSPFTGSVSALVGLVGSINYRFNYKNSEVLIGGKREKVKALRLGLCLWNVI
jgi:hypothetical protein